LQTIAKHGIPQSVVNVLWPCSLLLGPWRSNRYSGRLETPRNEKSAENEETKTSGPKKKKKKIGKINLVSRNYYTSTELLPR
jgi:hypothetical protein